MKRIGYLLEEVAEIGNLTDAFAKAARGKRRRAEVRTFEDELDGHLAKLVEELESGSYRPGTFRRFVVRDPKVRVIHAAPFRDRVVHHGIMNVAALHFERGAIDQSYACRVGKGNQAALGEAMRGSRKRSHWLKLDVRKYFDSIDHAILKTLFRRRFKDEAFLTLLDRIVGGYETAPGKGLPIGSLTSQYFANFYLDGFDHWVREVLGLRGYVRFMDDMVFWSDDPDGLVDAERRIREWMRSERQLELKPSVSGRSRDGLPFLGYRVMPGRLLLGRRARKRFRRRFGEAETAWRCGQIDEDGLQRRTMALLGYVGQAECLGWRQRLFADREEGALSGV
ncbi:MAG: reverse transcriptase domain-containing protein [Verrucomicrobiota bacterium]